MRKAVEGAKYDVVIALGKRKLPGDVHLSVESGLTALAAGELLANGTAKRVIFTGGHTDGKDNPSEARSMFYHMDRKYKGYADSATLEEGALDTSNNAKNTRGSIKPGEKVGLLSVDYHLPRASRVFGSHGIYADAIGAEGVLRKKSDSMGRVLDKYHNSCRHRIELLKEMILAPISWVDPKGIMLRGLAYLLRGRK